MSDRPVVVIVGGGFGGLTLVRKLRRLPVRTVLVDRRNHHLFQPLLYQVATAALSETEIAQPIRGITRGAADLTVLLDTAVGADLDRRTLALASGRQLAYDMLVVATGVEYDYLGHHEWADHALSLKSLGDALAIRERLLLAFEEAETTDDPAERQRLLTFVLIGGGPTGVELAGSIAELARYGLRRDFRRINPAAARIVLVEAGPSLLGGFAAPLAAYALQRLQKLGVEVRLHSPVQDIDAQGAVLADQRIDAGLVLWCAGVRGTRAGEWLGASGRHGTVPVEPDLSLPSHPEVFVIGDLAQVPLPGGQRLAQVAAVAKQEAAYVARVIAARLAGHHAPGPFGYRDPGSLAIIGRAAAVAQFGRVRLSGLFAWMVWGVAHIFFLIGFPNRIGVFLTWAWEWLTYRRGARLIIAAREEPGTAPPGARR